MLQCLNVSTISDHDYCICGTYKIACVLVLYVCVFDLLHMNLNLNHYSLDIAIFMNTKFHKPDPHTPRALYVNFK